MAALLKANELTKIYAKGQRPSLNKVSFNVGEGEFVAIMGASGSGKTTLLNVLSTIDTPTSGSIIINGVNLKQLSDTGAADFRRDNLGFIFQEYFLLDSLTIRENISVPLTLQKLPPKKMGLVRCEKSAERKMKFHAVPAIIGFCCIILGYILALDILRGVKSVWFTIGYTPIAILTLVLVVVANVLYQIICSIYLKNWVLHQRLKL